MADHGQTAASAIIVDPVSNHDASAEEYDREEYDGEEDDGEEDDEEGYDEDEYEDEDDSVDDGRFPHDTPDVRKWKRSLGNHLDEVQATAQFATAYPVLHPANPGLIVNDTLIPLPLVPRDAEILKAACRRAPFGRGDETVVDESVRKTWELDHTQFQLANPAWPGFLHSLIPGVTGPLGMKNVRIEPYKLLLYEEGSFFQRHRDSEKVPGMIGTIVVSLPSRHEGGDVHLFLNGKAMQFSTSIVSTYDMTVLAWYSDVTHEITKLISGYRLVLTYNIVQQGSDHPIPSDLIKQQSDMGELLHQWDANFENLTCIIYPLDHKYTKASLSLANMKGRDRGICYTLNDLSKKHGFFMFLADLTKAGEYDDEKYNAETEVRHRLGDVYTLDGRRILSDVSIQPGDVIGSSLYDNRKPDSYDEAEFTGNENMPARFRYKDKVVMLVRRGRLHKLLSRNIARADARLLLGFVLQDLRDNFHQPKAQSSAMMFMSELLNVYDKTNDIYSYDYGRSSGSGLGDVTYGMIASWTLALGRFDIYSMAAQQATRDREINSILGVIGSQIKARQSEVEHADWGLWFSAVARESDNQAWISTFTDLLKSVNANDQVLSSFSSWQTTLIPQQLDRTPSFKIEDCAYLLELVEKHVARGDTVSEKIRESLMNALASRAEKQLLCVILCDLLGRPDADLVGKCHKDLGVAILEKSVSKLSLDMSDFPPVPYAPRYSYRAGGNCYLNFLELVDCCFKGDLASIASGLIETSCDEMMPIRAGWPGQHDLKVEPMQSFLLRLCIVFQENQLPFSPVQDLWEALLQKYIVQTLPTPPEKLEGLAYKPRACSSLLCKECPQLDAFLRSETEKVYEVPSAQTRRTHVEKRLQYAGLGLRTIVNPSRRSDRILVITKRGPSSQHDPDHLEYQKKLDVIHSRLMPLRSDPVRQALGDKKYSELVMLRPSGPEVSTEVSNATNSGQKRAADDMLDDGPSKLSRVS